MATTPVVAPDGPAPIHHFGRLVGIFFSPKATFEDIVRRPSWIYPVVLMTVLGLVTAFVMNQKVDWRDVASKRIEESPRAANLSPEQKEKQLEMSEKISPVITYCFGLLVPILGVLIVAAVMMLAFNVIAGAGAKFNVCMGIVSHAFLVTILSTLFFILVLYLKPPGTLDLDNPVATNIGAFLPESTSKPFMALARSIDVFTVWMLLLMAIGFAAVNPKKLKGKSLGIVLTLWVIWVGVKVAGAWIFS